MKARGILLGAFSGGVAGLALVVGVVITKFGPLVNSSRPTHGPILVALIVVPAGLGAAVGWVRSRK